MEQHPNNGEDWQDNLGTELTDFMYSIIAIKGKSYGELLSVVLQITSSLRSFSEFNLETIQVMDDNEKKAMRLLEFHSIVSEMSGRITSLIHELVHRYGPAICEEKQRSEDNAYCMVIQEEIEKDAKMFLRKELEYQVGKTKRKET